MPTVFDFFRRKNSKTLKSPFKSLKNYYSIPSNDFTKKKWEIDYFKQQKIKEFIGNRSLKYSDFKARKNNFIGTLANPKRDEESYFMKEIRKINRLFENADFKNITNDKKYENYIKYIKKLKSRIENFILFYKSNKSKSEGLVIMVEDIKNKGEILKDLEKLMFIFNKFQIIKQLKNIKSPDGFENFFIKIDEFFKDKVKSKEFLDNYSTIIKDFETRTIRSYSIIELNPFMGFIGFNIFVYLFFLTFFTGGEGSYEYLKDGLKKFNTKYIETYDKENVKFLMDNMGHMEKFFFKILLKILGFDSIHDLKPIRNLVDQNSRLSLDTLGFRDTNGTYRNYNEEVKKLQDLYHDGFIPDTGSDLKTNKRTNGTHKNYTRTDTHIDTKKLLESYDELFKKYDTHFNLPSNTRTKYKGITFTKL